MMQEKDMVVRVLFGDDKPEIREDLTKALRECKLKVDLASTPQEVIAKARAGNYLAVITDLNYTRDGNEGYDVLRELRDNSSCKILYTAKMGFEFAAEGLEKGADYVILRKDKSQLIELVTKLAGEIK